MPTDQITSTVLMVRPNHFGYNAETAANNAFQRSPEGQTPKTIIRDALQEFAAFAQRLEEAGVRVIIVEDTPDPVKPDAVFPNNWISTHADGSVVTYPMYAPTRRPERRVDIVELLNENFRIEQVVAMQEAEDRKLYLEGTGSMILDRTHRLLYACRSERTSEELVADFSRQMGYRMILFNAVDAGGRPVYHTNVMMALGRDLVVICLDALPERAERDELLHYFSETGKKVVEIDLRQMNAFAGNMLQLADSAGNPIMVMSEQAFRSLRSDQIEAIKASCAILHSPLDTIETYGGGSARCMLAEIFLPENT